MDTKGFETLKPRLGTTSSYLSVRLEVQLDALLGVGALVVAGPSSADAGHHHLGNMVTDP